MPEGPRRGAGTGAADTRGGAPLLATRPLLQDRSTAGVADPGARTCSSVFRLSWFQKLVEAGRLHALCAHLSTMALPGHPSPPGSGDTVVSTPRETDPPRSAPQSCCGGSDGCLEGTASAGQPPALPGPPRSPAPRAPRPLAPPPSHRHLSSGGQEWPSVPGRILGAGDVRGMGSCVPWSAGAGDEGGAGLPPVRPSPGGGRQARVFTLLAGFLARPRDRGRADRGHHLALFSRLPVLLPLPGRQSDRHQLRRHHLVSTEPPARLTPAAAGR